MNAVIMVGQLLVSLSLLIFIHELGHFLAARIFGIRVNKFFIFFDTKFSIVKWKRINGKLQYKFFSSSLPLAEAEKDYKGDYIKDEKGKIKYRNISLDSLPENDWRLYPETTEYGIGWLPLGGYVKIAGMVDESLDMAQLKKDPQKWEFRSKPAWQRFIVMIAGVVMNVILGVLIFGFIHLAFTKKYIPLENVPEGIYAYQTARDINLRSGDKIIAINGKTTERIDDILLTTNLAFAKTITVERNGMTIEIQSDKDIYTIIKNGEDFIGLHNFSVLIDTVAPELPAAIAGMKVGAKVLFIDDEWITSFGQMKEKLVSCKNKNTQFIVDSNGKTDTLMIQVDSLGKIGVNPVFPIYETKNYNFASAMKYGYRDAYSMLIANIKGLGKVIKGEEKAREALSGPIGIAKMYGSVWNWHKFWTLTAVLSMVLAFMNILPIPALDGGHAIICFIEAVTRRKMPDKFMEVLQIIGMIIIFALMIFVIGNDIIKLIIN